MIKINLTTLGCPKNTVDSSHLLKVLMSHGFEHVSDADDADILLINTCGFIKDAKEESIEEVLRLAHIKKSKKLEVRSKKSEAQSQNSKILIVFGCLAQRYRDELLKEIPEIDAIFGVGEDERIVEYCLKLNGSRVMGPGSIEETNKGSVLPCPVPRTPASHAYLKIAEGCNKKCTFCVIPSIRGRFRSVPREDILKEAAEYISSGVRELILVAQDITNYGGKSGKYDLVALLKDLAAVDGDFWIRLLYLYPTEITDELLDCIASEDKIQKYLDVPLQHSEDRMLRMMGRIGTRKDYIKLIRRIRKKIPGIALRTTFIVGFPGETEQDFNGLVDFMEEVRFERLGVFKYSPEEGTPASKLKGKITENTKERRFDEIMKRQAMISLEKNRELIGRQYNAIVDEIDDDAVIARLYSHAPEIDGVVIIEKGPESRVKGQGSKASVKIGDLVTVEVLDAYDYDLKGKIIGKI